MFLPELNYTVISGPSHSRKLNFLFKRTSIYDVADYSAQGTMSYEEFASRGRPGMTFIPQTSSTPTWGGRTPSFSTDGSRTPAFGTLGSRTPAWNSGSSRTPAWAGSSGSKTPAWGTSGSKTPAY